MSSSIKDYRQLIEKPWGKMFYDMIFRQLSLPTNPSLNILDFGAGFVSQLTIMHSITE